MTPPYIPLNSRWIVTVEDSTISQPCAITRDEDGQTIMDNEPYYPHAVDYGVQERAAKCYNACLGIPNPEEAIPKALAALEGALSALKNSTAYVEDAWPRKGIDRGMADIIEALQSFGYTFDTPEE